MTTAPNLQRSLATILTWLAVAVGAVFAYAVGASIARAFLSGGR